MSYITLADLKRRRTLSKKQLAHLATKYAGFKRAKPAPFVQFVLAHPELVDLDGGTPNRILGQVWSAYSSATTGLGQDSQQQSWWNWFFSGSDSPAPQTAYEKHEASFNQQQAGAMPAPNSAWGDMAYEAPPVEDIDIMAPQGSDSAEALGMMVRSAGMGQAPDAAAPAPAPAPAPASLPASSPAPADSHFARNAGIAVGALALGSGLALAYGWFSTPAPAPKRFNSGRRRKTFN
jgi:hypothetical protein